MGVDCDWRGRLRHSPGCAARPPVTDLGRRADLPAPGRLPDRPAPDLGPGDVPHVDRDAGAADGLAPQGLVDPAHFPHSLLWLPRAPHLDLLSPAPSHGLAS